MIRKQYWFPVAYMFCVTAFFSSIVIGLTRSTGELVEANEKLAFERAVLSVLPDVDVDKMRRLEIHNTFTKMISKSDITSDAYVARRNGQTIAYVLPISGQGFWAPIKGVIGIETDKKTITGIAFYEQNETPGLGAEITKAPFKNQFRGKVISSKGEQPLNIRRPGTTLGDNEVHAVTGATQTSSRLEIIINTELKKWRD
jgi:Na+-transporting NADH:ubiquinone oxidoreductase subunit C